MTKDGILGLAGDEKRLEARAQRAACVGYLATVHPVRQTHVGDKKVDLHARFQDLDSGGAVLGLDGGASCLLENFSHK